MSPESVKYLLNVVDPIISKDKDFEKQSHLLNDFA